jgi:DNA-binding NtrC family response regulator
MNILLVDDENALLEILGTALRASGHDVSTANDGAGALQAMQGRSFDAMVCDVRMPNVDGLSVLKHAQSHAPSTRVILMTAYATVPDAVTALQHGAVDYLRKPFMVEELLQRLETISTSQAVRTELGRGRADPLHAELVGRSTAMLRVHSLVEKFGPTDESVLITGETGTGKELLAAALHRSSKRRDGPFVVVNCAGIPETLMEAELFGHERGAFTGALKKRDGRFKAADKGTLLLDEVGELSPAAQAKLLRVLQEHQFEPLGSDQTIQVDVRVLSATHRNLKDMVARGTFREDLYYRLKILELDIPPLRDRLEDLPFLVAHFIKRFAGSEGPAGVSLGALRALSRYKYPGNVRELEHAVRHAVAVSGGKSEIELAHLPSDLTAGELKMDGVFDRHTPPPQPLVDAMREFEREYLERALKIAGGSKVRAAALLGISRKSLWAKLKRYRGEEEPEPAED